MVKVYTIDCPKCLVLEKKLIAKGIDFIKITDLEVFKKLGIDLFPMIEVDGKLLDFSNAIKYINSYNL